VLALGAASVCACSDDDRPPSAPYVEDRAACADFNPERNLYFGDLHVHTSWSFDAYLNEVRVDPAGAYAFAKGETVQIPPLGSDGQGTKALTIDRPLDFAAVTDHGEFIGEVSACAEENSPIFDTEFCQEMRNPLDASLMVAFGLRLNTNTPARFPQLCDETDPEAPMDCSARAAETWARMQEINEAAYDRSASCSFTSFHAYEWSGAIELSNLHRNVIFASERVPRVLTSHFEAPRDYELWDALERDCIEGLWGCDVLAIPHNSNWSNGRLFNTEYRSDMSEAKAAAQRNRLEPLMEIYQHKGESECANGVSGILGEPDEACDFEKLRLDFDDCADGVGEQGMAGGGCVSRRDFLRGALLAGMSEKERLGVNPLQLGVIASTDTHNGTPGAVSEANYAGHFGSREEDELARLNGAIPAGPLDSGGGLVAVWSEENSRSSLFDAMRRRETYGTSGPRMAVRFFGGWDLDSDACSRADLVEQGYAKGVPMGGHLERADSSTAGPTFVVDALRDPGGEGVETTRLERVQIVKGWIDASGSSHVDVIDVAGAPNGATVDPLTCEVSDDGDDRLCAFWQDPDFDPEQSAYYYVRVLENPSCRWSTRDCNALAPSRRLHQRKAPAVHPRTSLDQPHLVLAARRSELAIRPLHAKSRSQGKRPDEYFEAATRRERSELAIRPLHARSRSQGKRPDEYFKQLRAPTR
jgi:hypothetical protein